MTKGDAMLYLCGYRNYKCFDKNSDMNGSAYNRILRIAHKYFCVSYHHRLKQSAELTYCQFTVVTLKYQTVKIE